MDISQLQKFAQTVAIKAGQLLLREQSKVKIVKFKDKQDIATTADIKSEQLIISQIRDTFPDHNIFSEETGAINQNSPYTWIVDPLDGTKEYSRGLFGYAVLISCETSQHTLVGCVYLPATNELYSAGQNLGAYFNDRKISVSPQNQLDQAFVFTHLPNSKCPEPDFSNIWKTTANIARKSYRLRASAFDALSLCWLARGVLEGYVLLFEQGPRWHDLAAGLLIAQEAGAKITDRSGKSLQHQDLSRGILASNPRLHPQLLKILNS